ncbi:hypothetical protein G6F61_014322 [Rhizopus arrhizus]|nr:hypothetical protein G6F61_014322 [Rhizopus arrhizus]
MGQPIQGFAGVGGIAGVAGQAWAGVVGAVGPCAVCLCAFRPMAPALISAGVLMSLPAVIAPVTSRSPVALIDGVSSSTDSLAITCALAQVTMTLPLPTLTLSVVVSWSYSTMLPSAYWVRCRRRESAGAAKRSWYRLPSTSAWPGSP